MKIGIRTTRSVSFISVVVLILMILFGLIFWFLVGRVLIENEASSIFVFLFSAFMLCWIGVATYMAIFHGKNIKSKNGEFLFEVVDQSGVGNDRPMVDPMRQLRSLEKLKVDGLISLDEYKVKRDEIMRRQW